MTRRLPQSTSRVVTLKVFLASDHASAATGKTVAITISKNGGAFGNPNAGATNATEMTSGWYKVTLDTTDTNTIGDLVVRGTATACDDSEQLCDVVAATNGGLTSLDAAVSTRASQTSVDDVPTNAELATALGTADDAVLVQVALVKAKTDLIPADPADASDIAARFTTLDTSVADLPTNAELTAALGTADDAILVQVALVKAKTDALPTDPADQSLIIAATDALVALISDVPTNAELTVALGTADDAVLTQVALVKAKTDQLIFGVANVLNANVTHVNEIEVTGNGETGTEWGPAP